MSDVAELRRRVGKIAETEAGIRARNRAAAPEFAEFVSHLRGKFGDVKVRWIRWPDGREEGKRAAPGVIPALPIRRKQRG